MGASTIIAAAADDAEERRLWVVDRWIMDGKSFEYFISIGHEILLDNFFADQEVGGGEPSSGPQ